MNFAMMKMVGVALLGLMLMMPESAGAQADKRPLNIGIGFSAGYAEPLQESYSGNVQGGLLISIGLMKYLAVEIAAGYLGPNVEPSDDGLSKGKLTVIPIQLSLQGRYPLGDGRFVPYLEFGGGYSIHSFTLDDELAEDWERIGFTLEEKVESSPAFHFGAGLDYVMTGSISLGLGIRYILAKMNGSWSLTDEASSTKMSGDLESLSLNSLTFGLRLRYVF